jgi:hypothetical protein
MHRAVALTFDAVFAKLDALESDLRSDYTHRRNLAALVAALMPLAREAGSRTSEAAWQSLLLRAQHPRGQLLPDEPEEIPDPAAVVVNGNDEREPESRAPFPTDAWEHAIKDAIRRESWRRMQLDPSSQYIQRHGAIGVDYETALRQLIAHRTEAKWTVHVLDTSTLQIDVRADLAHVLLAQDRATALPWIARRAKDPAHLEALRQILFEIALKPCASDMEFLLAALNHCEDDECIYCIIDALESLGCESAWYVGRLTALSTAEHESRPMLLLAGLSALASRGDRVREEALAAFARKARTVELAGEALARVAALPSCDRYRDMFRAATVWEPWTRLRDTPFAGFFVCSATLDTEVDTPLLEAGSVGLERCGDVEGLVDALLGCSNYPHCYALAAPLIARICGLLLNKPSGAATQVGRIAAQREIARSPALHRLVPGDRAREWGALSRRTHGPLGRWGRIRRLAHGSSDQG